MPVTVLPSFSLDTLSPPEAKFLIDAYEAIFNDGLDTFQGTNSLGNLVSLNRYGLSSLLTDISVDNNLEPEQVIQRLRELAAVAQVEHSTTSLDQITLDSLISAQEEHLRKLKSINESSIIEVEKRLQNIATLANRVRTYSASSAPTLGSSPPTTSTTSTTTIQATPSDVESHLLTISRSYNLVVSPSALSTNSHAVTQSLQQVRSVAADTPAYTAARRQLEATLASILPPENIPAIAADLIRRTSPPTTETPNLPTTPQPINIQETTSQVVDQAIHETLNQLPLTSSQKDRLRSTIATQNTIGDLTSQIHNPDFLVPGQTLTETQVTALREQVLVKLENDLGNHLSPLAISAITDTVIGHALPVAKLTTELQLAQKTGGILLASENTPTFPPEIAKIQAQIEWIYKTIPDQKEAEEIISAAIATLEIPQNQKPNINLDDLKIQLQQGLHPNTIRVLQSGLTADGFSQAIQARIIPDIFISTRNKIRNTQNAASAAGAIPAQPPTQKLSRVRNIRVHDGKTQLSVSSVENHTQSLWFIVNKRLGHINRNEAITPRQLISVPSSPNNSPYSPFSPQSISQTRSRLTRTHKLLTSSQGRFALRLQHSPIGRLYNRIFNYFQERTLRKISTWAGKKTAVIAAKSAYGFVSSRLAFITVRSTVAKTAARSALKRIALKAGASILARLGIEAIAGATIAPVAGWVLLALDLGWQFLKNVVFNPKFWKKLFNWLTERPWVIAGLLAAPLLLGGPGIFLAGVGALGLVGIAATGGTAALLGLGTKFVGNIIALTGIIFSPILLPIIAIALVFLGSWLFLTIFYLLFILPQGFMSNQTARQIALIATEGPFYLSITKSALPRSFTNLQTAEIATTPQSVTFTISLIPDKNTSLTNIKMEEKLELIKVDNTGKVTTKALQAPNTWQSQIPSSVPAGTPATFSYTLQLDNQFLLLNFLTVGDLTDSLINNAVTFETDAQNGSETLKGIARSAQAVILLGNPQVSSPTGWPIWGSTTCVTQGPNAPFSHRRIQAIDISHPTNQPVRATHPGTISWWWDPADGYSVIVTSPDKLYSTLYAHLDRRTPIGPVNYGGIVGYTTTNMRNGFMTGPHLHYQLRGSPLNGPNINQYLSLPAPIPSVSISGCTYQGKDYHVKNP
ncbi:MAG: hypothetical protein UW73_C0009G0087 [Microgenomates group bacterium GW2011_GWB1_44_8]|nr:MAG: hypothetical protein UW73_C0009G0087 [Microgenomates group bacterium GW2011_GWB1_44_8]